jgi:hypothetical protein
MEDVGGYFRTCEDTDTIFTSALAGDWASRLCGVGPVVDYQKALSHSKMQTKTLVESHEYSILDGKKTRPLIYREADLDGNEIPVRVLFRKQKYVNNPWQTLAYQAFEAIYLDRVEEGLEIIKKVWEKGYYEGFPWDMDHWGWERDHIYMTHPVMWGIFSALSGAAFNAFKEALFISPRLLPESDELKIPLFFPDFWLMMDYSQRSGKLDFRVLKSFNSELKISKIVHQKPNGKKKSYQLPNEIKLQKDNTFSIMLK